jgi:23S rRNA (cytosine1962-C5)-methyltransferase
MSAPPAKRPTLRLRVTAAAEGAIRTGHPWVYSDSIRELNRDGEAGELAVIFDRENRFLAVGLFDPESPLRVRMLHVGKPATLDAAWWRTRLQAAVKRREGVIGPDTDGYRLINGESDGWPGLVLDRYAGTLVLKLYTAAWLPRLAEVTALVQELIAPERLVLRLSRNIQDAARRMGLVDGALLMPGATAGEDKVVFRESGIHFEADVVRGQKTGFFLDQRENRRLIETFARDADVLNAFSFSGGFSLYAARGGARSVTDLDISPHALASARRNFALNQDNATIRSARHEQVQADCFAWLAQSPPREFDVVILDPPSLAKREHERAGAIEAYGRLAADGIRRVRPGGLLLAASCSAHVSEEEFFGAVRTAAQRSGRRFTELRTTGHAPDHPAPFPEAKYLKAVYLRLEG